MVCTWYIHTCVYKLSLQETCCENVESKSIKMFNDAPILGIQSHIVLQNKIIPTQHQLLMQKCKLRLEKILRLRSRCKSVLFVDL